MPQSFKQPKADAMDSNSELVDAQRFSQIRPLSDPFDDGKASTGAPSRRDSFPFWLDREWIPAEQHYPEDDDTGISLLCFNSNVIRALVFDYDTRQFDIYPSISALKNSSKSTILARLSTK